MEAIEAPRTPPPGKSQPIAALAPDTQPVFNDNDVRAAIAQAEANNQDPQSLTMGDLAQGQIPNPPAKAPEVPEKFLKPDGAVDVEKLQASTRQLDEGIRKKEEAIQEANRTIEDFVRDNQERERKFRNMPNADKIRASLPAQPLEEAPALAPQNFEEIVRRDYAADPLGTTTRLFDLMLQKKFAPIEEKEKLESVRTNVQQIAEHDPRILRPDVYAAVNAKLAEWKVDDPHRYQQRNPHKAAWLEVKDELRLGDPIQGQAQPSRPSPILGGGTPPSAPSSSATVPAQDIAANLHKLDIRDKKQEALGDEAVRAMLQGSRG